MDAGAHMRRCEDMDETLVGDSGISGSRTELTIRLEEAEMQAPSTPRAENRQWNCRQT